MKTIRDFDLNGKRVIIRCDFNVPMKGTKIADDTRIRESLETIEYAINNGAKVILMSHLGKVKTKEDMDGKSLFPVSERLSKLLKKEVKFCPKTHGKMLSNMVNKLECGDVLLMENTRFEDINGKRESGNDEELGKEWASLGDIFINDAYGTLHRPHTSVVGICKYLPSGIGFLVEKEITKIDSIMKEKSHPFVIVMGGKKISDKIKLTENLIKKCDRILVGGALCYSFLYAKGINVGKNLVDTDSIKFCKRMLKRYGHKIILPVDAITGDNVVKNINKLDDNDICFDIGPKTIRLFERKLWRSKRVILNGPLGMFEDDRFIYGTKAIYGYIVRKNIKALVGGGDSISSINKLGFTGKFYHVSTGGGATLEYLSGIKLPGIMAIKERKN